MARRDRTADELAARAQAGAAARLRRIHDALARLEVDVYDERALEDLDGHLRHLVGALTLAPNEVLAERPAALAAAVASHLDERRPPLRESVVGWREAARAMERALATPDGAALEASADPVALGVVHALDLSSGPRRPNVLLLAMAGPARDAMRAALLSEELRVRVAADRATARRLLRAERADVLVVDVGAHGGTADQVIATLRALPGGQAALVVRLNARGDLVGRVANLASGADLAFPRMADAAPVAREIRAWLDRDRPSVSTVALVVGDDDDDAYLERLLTGAGYSARRARDVEALQGLFDRARPDAVVVGVQADGATAGLAVSRPPRGGADARSALRRGAEIIGALRLGPHAELPIIALADGEAAQIEALAAGADEAWLRPVAPRVLLASLASRLRRLAAIEAGDDVDPLTGALTHGAFVRRVDAWLRQQGPRGTIALVDVVGLRAINRRFGHVVGDHVLRALRRALAVGTPGGQLIGRVDGGTFAVLRFVDAAASADTEPGAATAGAATADDATADDATADDGVEVRAARFAAAPCFVPDGRGVRVALRVAEARAAATHASAAAWIATCEDGLMARRDAAVRGRIGAGAPAVAARTGNLPLVAATAAPAPPQGAPASTPPRRKRSLLARLDEGKRRAEAGSEGDGATSHAPSLTAAATLSVDEP